MKTLVLADFDNFRNKNRNSDFDFEISVSKIKSAIAKVEKAITNEEILVRLYGGWLNEFGKFTPRAQILLRFLPDLRTRIGRKIVKSELALGILGSSPRENIRCLHLSSQNKQKMVDTLISVDAVKSSEYTELVVFSKDTDLLPPILEASHSKRIILVTSKCEAIDSNIVLLNSKNILLMNTLGEVYA